MDHETQLSRRERQIMDVVYALGHASATGVVAGMLDPTSRTAVRTMLRILEEKGHLKHEKKGRQFVYHPTRARRRAGQSAMQRVLSTFFDGSLEKAVAAHITDPGAKLPPEELKRLGELIQQARRKGT